MSDALLPAADATRAGRAGWLGVLLSVLLVALGVLVIRDALVAGGQVSGEPWLAPVVDRADGLAPSTLVSVVGVVLALLGLWLVAIALGRRVRTRLPLTTPGVTVGITDVARLASSAAEDVPGVLSVSSGARRTSVTVRVTALEGDDLEDDVSAAVRHRLDLLAAPMTVRVTTRHVAGLHSGGVL